ncbi:MAG TPA: hypothetical protein VMT57_00310, partial [Candidatus Thermoplasmatota archaeon]|nr:hypothetical protein [Candidatus Thermoplasmatota archaeon]
NTSSIQSAVKQASKDNALLEQHLHNILSKDDQTRFQSHKVLESLSLEYPLVLYEHWDFLAGLLGSSNHYHRFIALSLVANLVSVDSKKKFEKIADAYFANIGGTRTMVAVQATVYAGKIAKAKPHLQKRITNLLLLADTVHQGKQTELIKAAAIQAFDVYFETATDKKNIVEFVRAQQESKSPKTRKAAKEFLQKWGTNHRSL